MRQVTPGRAAIGAGVGALTGAVVGNSIDERNKAIEAQYARQLVAGRVTKEEVINMSQNHVDEALIVNYVRALHGLAYPLSSADIIMLQQYGVSPQVITVMQEAPPPPAVIVEQAPPPPVVVGGYFYGRPYYRHGYYY